MKDVDKLGVLATLCETCFLDNDGKNLTSTEKENTLTLPNLFPQHSIRGFGKITMNSEEEMYDKEGTPIDAEVTIIVKVNKNIINNSTVAKKLLMDKLDTLAQNLKEIRE